MNITLFHSLVNAELQNISRWLSLLNKVPRVLVRVPKCSSSAQVPNFPLSALRVKKVWHISRKYFNREFVNLSEYILFSITLIVFSFLGNKMKNFLARYESDHPKGFQKLSLIIFAKVSEN